MADLILMSLPVNLCWLLGVMFPRPLIAFLPGILLSTLFVLLSVWLCRHGKINAACISFLSSTLAGCTFTLFLYTNRNPGLSVLFYLSYGYPVLLAGFLMNKRALIAVTLAASSLIVLHVWRDRIDYTPSGQLQAAIGINDRQASVSKGGTNLSNTLPSASLARNEVTPPQWNMHPPDSVPPPYIGNAGERQHDLAHGRPVGPPPEPMGSERYFVFLVVPISSLLSLAVLALCCSSNMVDYAREADERAREAEQLSDDLNRTVASLQMRSDDITRQSKQLQEANSELLVMQSELQESYRILEDLNQKLEKQATTDVMTGLGNHRLFQITIRQRVSSALRLKQPLSLIMMDVDFFKKYNDEFGHPAGDFILQSIGSILMSISRRDDLVARYGGEEFGVILPYTDVPMAMMVAERIRQTIANTEFPNRQITISAGVASLHLHADDADSLIHAADVALYEAKRAGRNKVAMAETARAKNDRKPIRILESDLLLSSIPASRKKLLSPAVADAFGGIEGLLQEPSGPVFGAILAALDMRDAETQGHSQRVARYALRTATAYADLHEKRLEAGKPSPLLTPRNYRDLALGALLHDIGKISTPDYILRKPAMLTEEEWAVMRIHPVAGAELVSCFEMLEAAYPVVHCHHERWDGFGYPDGLCGADIPLSARIFAVADTLDAITTDRPYRSALPFTTAFNDITQQSDTQFDPDVVEAFLSVPKSEWELLRDTQSPFPDKAMAA